VRYITVNTLKAIKPVKRMLISPKTIQINTQAVGSRFYRMRNLRQDSYTKPN